MQMNLSFRPLFLWAKGNPPLQKGIDLAIILGSALFILWLGQFLINRFFEKRAKKAENGYFATIHSIFYSIFRIFVLFSALMDALRILGVNTSSILTAAGVGGIAIAFGAQKIIADIFTGITFLMNNELHLGDYVVLSGCEGTVVSMSLYRIRVQGYSGILYIIPNSSVEIISNYRKDPVFCDVTLALPNGFSLEKAKTLLEKVLDELYEKHSSLFLQKPSFMGIDAVNPFTYSYRINIRTLIGDSWSCQRMVREACLQALQKEGVFARLFDEPEALNMPTTSLRSIESRDHE